MPVDFASEQTWFLQNPQSTSGLIMQSRIFLSNRPIRTLVLSFFTWKTLLLIIAAASPGPGYDTSASLLKPNRRSSENLDGELLPALRYLVERLTRWDAIYFIRTANRGYLFEQEWAFGWGFSRIIALCTAGEDVIQIHIFRFYTDNNYRHWKARSSSL